MICNLGSRIVNNYLISSKAGYILIETGYAGGFSHFIKILKKRHIQPKEIRYIFLTHAHDYDNENRIIDCICCTYPLRKQNN